MFLESNKFMVNGVFGLLVLKNVSLGNHFVSIGYSTIALYVCVEQRGTPYFSPPAKDGFTKNAAGSLRPDPLYTWSCSTGTARPVNEIVIAGDILKIVSVFCYLRYFMSLRGGYMNLLPLCGLNLLEKYSESSFLS